MLGSLLDVVVVIVVIVFEFPLKVNGSRIATEVEVNCSFYGVAAGFAFVSYLPLVTVVLAGDFERQLVILDLDVLRFNISTSTRVHAGELFAFFRELEVGAISCPLALVLLFMVPDFQSEAITASYIAVILLLFATAFTFFNVPYLAMPAEMTRHPDERTLIMTQRIFFSTLGVLMISTVGPQLIFRFGGGSDGYIRMSWVMAGTVLIAMSLTFGLTKNTRSLPPSRRENYGLYKQWRLLLRNRPFRFYMLAKICLFMAQMAKTRLVREAQIPPPLSLSRPMKGSLSASTLLPSIASIAGSRVREAISATRTTMMTPMDMETKISFPVKINPASERSTVTPA